MRILVLSKRQYTGKDLLDDRYGRLYEIPAELAARGHEVRGIALSYRRRREGRYRWPGRPRLEWHSVNALPTGIFRYRSHLGQVIREFQPDLIWACSDVLHALIGWKLKKNLRLPLVLDLYDNFEAFKLSRLPGATRLLRAACRHADGLSVVSHALRDYVVDHYGITAPCAVISNGIQESLFLPRNRSSARRLLGLPEGARLIGTAGAITADRGISDLFDAFLRLAATDDDLWLVYAGPRDSTPRRYHHGRIIDLGILPHGKASYLFAALDVAVVCNQDSPFGRYCFPQKFYEIMACGTPVVAAATGDVRHLLEDWPANLYPPGDSSALAERISRLLNHEPCVPKLPVPSWKRLAESMEIFFESLAPS